MASRINSGIKLIQRSTTTARSLLTRISSSSSASSAATATGGGSRSKFTQPLPTNSSSSSSSSRLFSQKKSPFSSSRVPVELSCAVESLMPFHSATASALLNSMLSSQVGKWGVLSEGFATPL